MRLLHPGQTTSLRRRRSTARQAEVLSHAAGRMPHNMQRRHVPPVPWRRCVDASLFSPLFLSRIQFGFVISFHILFPAFTIGLASWLAFLEALWLRTREDRVRDLYFFWLKIFAV